MQITKETLRRIIREELSIGGAQGAPVSRDTIPPEIVRRPPPPPPRGTPSAPRQQVDAALRGVRMVLRTLGESPIGEVPEVGAASEALLAAVETAHRIHMDPMTDPKWGVEPTE